MPTKGPSPADKSVDEENSNGKFDMDNDDDDNDDDGDVGIIVLLVANNRLPDVVKKTIMEMKLMNCLVVFV